MSQVVGFIGQLSLVILILSLEQVYGLPLIALALSLYFSTGFSEFVRVAFLLLVGVCISLLFQLPFVTGTIIMLGLSAAFSMFQTWLPSIESRLWIVSVLGSLVIFFISLMQVQVSLLVSFFTSMLITWFLSLILYQPRIAKYTQRGRYQA